MHGFLHGMEYILQLDKMASRKHAQKRGAQIFNISNNSTPIKAVHSKIPKPNNTPEKIGESSAPNEVKLEDIHAMMQIMMKKLDKLELIEDRIKNVESDLKDVRESIDFAHAEVEDLKEDQKIRKIKDEEIRVKVEKLEQENIALNNSVIDLKARSMRDNLIFFNIEETERENTTSIIHKILEENMDIEDAANKIKVDRSHRLGKRREQNAKPRPIVVKFNYHQDKEDIRRNAKKLKGTRIGISEQFPEEINRVRRRLYPEYKKAKAEGKQAKMVKDKLFIEGREFKLT